MIESYLNFIRFISCSTSRNQGAFYNFVNSIRADGGGDSAEDIMGGLQAAFSRLSWGDEEVVKVTKVYNLDIAYKIVW